MDKNILVLGDSHALIFKSKINKLLLWKRRFIVTSVQGATISGLENPNSKTNAYKIFLDSLIVNTGIQTVIFLLGEVDVGFVIWYRAQKYGVEVAEMLEQTLTQYNTLLNNAQLKGKKVMVISAPLPTIPDGHQWGEVANLRKEITANLAQRTDLALKFNARLKKIVENNGQIFVDLDKASLSRKGAGVKKILRNLNKSDHHYNRFVYAVILRMKLWKYGL